MSRIRANQFTDKAGTGAPTFPNGVQVTGVSTLGNTVVGGGTTQLIVTGNARITGILTIGTSSITLDGSSNQVNVGTGVTLHHTNGVQVGGNTLHSTVLTVNQINASGVITATSFSGSGANLTGIAATTDVRTNSLVVSGITTVAAGSAAAPSITPTGDSNTGIFFPSADTIAFGEGGAEALRIDSSGQVGIGTNSPSSNLHVIGGATSGGVDTAAIFKGGSGNGGGVRICLSSVAGFETTRGAYIEAVNEASGNDHSLRFATNSHTASPVERARIDSSGRLLVGMFTATANGGVIQTSNGITFPATQSACSDANTLDDYEEGTWTPNQGAGLTVSGTFTSSGFYTKVGRQVTVWATVRGSTSISISAGQTICTNLPFSVSPSGGVNGNPGSGTNWANNVLVGCSAGPNSADLYATSAVSSTFGIMYCVAYNVS